MLTVDKKFFLNTNMIFLFLISHQKPSQNLCNNFRKQFCDHKVFKTAYTYLCIICF